MFVCAKLTLNCLLKFNILNESEIAQVTKVGLLYRPVFDEAAEELSRYSFLLLFLLVEKITENSSYLSCPRRSTLYALPSSFSHVLSYLLRDCLLFKYIYLYSPLSAAVTGAARGQQSAGTIFQVTKPTQTVFTTYILKLYPFIFEVRLNYLAYLPTFAGAFFVCFWFKRVDLCFNKFLFTLLKFPKVF